MKHSLLLGYLLTACLALPLTVRAQNIGIGTTTPDPSAVLDVKASDKGLLPPRMTAAQRAAIANPAQGLLVYQTDGTPGYYYFSGAAWLNLSTGTPPGAAGTLPAPATRGYVTTLAGTGAIGNADGAASAAQFGFPIAAAVDGAGRVYIADRNNHVIRLIENGQVSTLAGAGQFSFPSGVAVDGQGRVYVADTGHNRICLIENGQVTTLAGSGAAGYQNGPAATAQFRIPTAVAVDDQGGVYVADYSNHAIRLIRNGQVSTLAGTGAAGNSDGPVASALLDGPSGVAVDGQRRVYVADTNNNRICLVDNGLVSTLSTGGANGFDNPTGVAVDGMGRVYVADQNNNAIRLIENGQVSTLAGGGFGGSADGPAATAQFKNPAGVAVDAQGTVYVADMLNYKVRRLGGASTSLPTLTLNGSSLGLVGGNTVTLPVATAQTLALSGQALSISGGNTVTLPTATAQTLSVSGQNLSISGGNSVTLPTPAGDNLGNHTATGPIKYSTNDADKIWFTAASGASGSKLEHAAGWLLNYYAGPNNGLAGVHRFLTGTGSGWRERMRIDDSGNVGIGTDNPQRTLDVNGSIRQTTYASGLLALSGTSIASFDWTHNLGYQPTLMLSLDQTGGDGAEYVVASYEHLNANTIRFHLRNTRGSNASFYLRWIRVD